MMLVDLPRAAILRPGFFQPSPPVPVRVRPPRPKATGTPGAGLSDEMLSALAVLNVGDAELGYDDWRNAIFAIHFETGGSADGLALAHEVSARSIKYDPDFLDERVWPYVSSARESAITGRSIPALARRFGWQSAADAGSIDCFDATESEADGIQTQSNQSADGVSDAAERRGVPEAQHLCTDQANAVRLMKAFGSRMLVAAGRWYAWSGRHWAPDEADVYRHACRLSGIVKDEAEAMRGKAGEALAAGDQGLATKLGAMAESLGKWAKTCEMKGTIEAALGLLRKMLGVEVDLLDRDPLLLNVGNGTVDLRDGTLRRHDAGDYITKLTRVPYAAGADSQLWERVLGEVFGGDESLVGFFERWCGYCATGDVREQKFVVHWGGGANGKSTLLDTVAEVLGDYAGTAAPGLLLAAKGERHPTELAALQGLRMVTAHESGDGVVLREDMIKQATGGDKITARRMREDFYTFAPTHKLQLLTNHKPMVKGTDHGMWRRVLLVPYGARFGSEGDVARGEATAVADLDLVARLRGERAGILARIVRAAVSWGRGGLCPPDRVLMASAEYRGEQDRVAQFVAEVCETGYGFSEPLTLGMGGLYPEYVSWCKDGGIQPLAKNRMLAEVLRVVPKSETREQKIAGESGKRRDVRMVYGVRIVPE